MYVVPRVITDLLPQLLRHICITVRHVTSCCAMPCRVLPFPCPSLPISFLVLPISAWPDACHCESREGALCRRSDPKTTCSVFLGSPTMPGKATCRTCLCLHLCCVVEPLTLPLRKLRSDTASSRPLHVLSTSSPRPFHALLMSAPCSLHVRSLFFSCPFHVLFTNLVQIIEYVDLQQMTREA